jgi:hypothetical protein
VNFSDPDPIIVFDTRLIDASGTTLPLHPRTAGFDTGAADQASGLLELRLFNFGDRLLVHRLQVQQLPRLASLESMVPGQALVDLVGAPVRPWREGAQPALADRALEQNGELQTPLARLNQGPHVTKRVTAADCNAQDRMRGPDTDTCRPGVMYDLFPSTTLMVTAELVDPAARHWDPATKKYLVGPVTTTVFYQVAGRRRSDAQTQQQGAAGR